MKFLLSKLSLLTSSIMKFLISKDKIIGLRIFFIKFCV